MATSVNLSKELLHALDVEAARRGMSRSRFIVYVLSRVVENQRDEWHPDLIARLRETVLKTQRDR